MDNHIEIYENVLSTDLCEQIIEKFEEEDENGLTYPGTTYNSLLDTNIKDTTDLILNKLTLFQSQNIDINQKTEEHQKWLDNLDTIYKAISKYAIRYIQKYSCITNWVPMIESGDIHKTFMPDIILAKRYVPPNQHFTWHMDHSPELPRKILENPESSKSFLRCMVFLFYLNDVEEGGETEFLYQDLKVKPKAGSLVVFPPYYTHAHRGNPVIKGNKYIINTWLKWR